MLIFKPFLFFTLVIFWITSSIEVFASERIESQLTISNHHIQPEQAIDLTVSLFNLSEVNSAEGLALIFPLPDSFRLVPGAEIQNSCAGQITVDETQQAPLLNLNQGRIEKSDADGVGQCELRFQVMASQRGVFEFALSESSLTAHLGPHFTRYSSTVQNVQVDVKPIDLKVGFEFGDRVEAQAVIQAGDHLQRVIQLGNPNGVDIDLTDFIDPVGQFFTGLVFDPTTAVNTTCKTDHAPASFNQLIPIDKPNLAKPFIKAQRYDIAFSQLAIPAKGECEIRYSLSSALTNSLRYFKKTEQLQISKGTLKTRQGVSNQRDVYNQLQSRSGVETFLTWAGARNTSVDLRSAGQDPTVELSIGFKGYLSTAFRGAKSLTLPDFLAVSAIKENHCPIEVSLSADADELHFEGDWQALSKLPGQCMLKAELRVLGTGAATLQLSELHLLDQDQADQLDLTYQSLHHTGFIQVVHSDQQPQITFDHYFEQSTHHQGDRAVLVTRVENHSDQQTLADLSILNSLDDMCFSRHCGDHKNLLIHHWKRPQWSCSSAQITAVEGDSSYQLTDAVVPPKSVCYLEMPLSVATTAQPLDTFLYDLLDKDDVSYQFGKSDDIAMPSSLSARLKIAPAIVSRLKFMDRAISNGGTTTVSVAVQYQGNQQARVNDLGFQTDLPSGLILADPLNLSSDCFEHTYSEAYSDNPRRLVLKGGSLDTRNSSSCHVTFDVIAQAPLIDFPDAKIDYSLLSNESQQNASGLAQFNAKSGLQGAMRIHDVRGDQLEIRTSAVLISKQIYPVNIAVGQAAEVSLLINNQGQESIELTGVVIRDDFSSHDGKAFFLHDLTQARFKNLSESAQNPKTCHAASIEAQAGGRSVVLRGGVIPANTQCVLSYQVTASQSGLYQSTFYDDPVELSSDQGVKHAFADQGKLTLNVNSDVSVTHHFSPVQISPGQRSKLTLTLINGNAQYQNPRINQITGADAALVTNIPQGLRLIEIAKPDSTDMACQGVDLSIIKVIDGDKESNQLQLGGGVFPAGTRCSFSVWVSADQPGEYHHTIDSSALKSKEGLTNQQSSSSVLRVNNPLNYKIHFVHKEDNHHQAYLRFEFDQATAAQVKPNNSPVTHLNLSQRLPRGMRFVLPLQVDNQCGSELDTTHSVHDHLFLKQISLNKQCNIDVAIQTDYPGDYQLPPVQWTLADAAVPMRNADLPRYTAAKPLDIHVKWSPQRVSAGEITRATIHFSQTEHLASRLDKLDWLLPALESGGALVLAPDFKPSEVEVSGCEMRPEFYNGDQLQALQSGDALISLRNIAVSKGQVCQLTFNVMATSAGLYQDTKTQTQQISHEPLRVTQAKASLGVSLAVVNHHQVNADQLELTYRVHIENTGDSVLTDFRLSQSLQSVFNSAQDWSILGIHSDVLPLNPLFDGREQIELLLSDGQSLQAGQHANIDLNVLITPGDDLEVFSNQAQVFARTYTGLSLSDWSVDGESVELDADNNPQNDQSVTEFEIKKPIDLTLELIDAPTVYAPGGRVEYRFVLREKAGRQVDQALISHLFPIVFEQQSWQCIAHKGASCSASRGNQDISGLSVSLNAANPEITPSNQKNTDDNWYGSVEIAVEAQLTAYASGIINLDFEVQSAANQQDEALYNNQFQHSMVSLNPLSCEATPLLVQSDVGQRSLYQSKFEQSLSFEALQTQTNQPTDIASFGGFAYHPQQQLAYAVMDDQAQLLMMGQGGVSLLAETVEGLPVQTYHGGVILGDQYFVKAAGNNKLLYRIDLSQRPAVAKPITLNRSLDLRALSAFSEDQLYGFDESLGQLVKFDHRGSVTALGFSGQHNDVKFDQLMAYDDGRLLGIDASGSGLYQLNPETGHKLRLMPAPAMSGAEGANCAQYSPVFSTEISVSLKDGTDDYERGQTEQYQLRIENTSDTGVSGLQLRTESNASEVSWRCETSSASDCLASGQGDLDLVIDLAGQDSMVFYVDVISSDLSESQLHHSASIGLPDGFTDSSLGQRPEAHQVHDQNRIYHPAIGTALALTQISIFDEQHYSLSFRAIIENIGEAPLNQVQLLNALSQNNLLGQAFVSVSEGPVFNQVLSHYSAKPKINQHWDGDQNANILNTGPAILQPEERWVVDYTVLASSAKGVVGSLGFNQVEGIAATPLNNSVRDLSQPGETVSALATDHNQATELSLNHGENARAAIGLVKQLINLRPLTNDQFEADFQISFQNIGSQPLFELDLHTALSDSINLGDQFVRISQKPVWINQNSTVVNMDSRPVINPEFDGQDNTALLAPGGQLQAGERLDLVFSVVVQGPLSGLGAQAEILALTSSGESVRDWSDSHRIIDLDGDGVANEVLENRPTQLSLPVVTITEQQVGLSQHIHQIVKAQGNEYQIELELRVQNTGLFAINQISVRQDFTDHALLGNAYVGLVSKPFITGSDHRINPLFDGTSENPEMVLINDVSLQAGQITSVRFWIRVNPELVSSEQIGKLQLQASANAFATNEGQEREPLNDLSNPGLNPSVSPGGKGEANRLALDTETFQSERLVIKSRLLSSFETNSTQDSMLLGLEVSLQNVGDQPLKSVQISQDLSALLGDGFIAVSQMPEVLASDLDQSPRFSDQFPKMYFRQWQSTIEPGQSLVFKYGLRLKDLAAIDALLNAVILVQAYDESLQLSEQFTVMTLDQRNESRLSADHTQASDLSLQGSLWFDPNHNQQLDPTERLLNDWLIRLTHQDGLIQESQVDEKGSYSFTQLNPGDYRLSVLNSVGVVYQQIEVSVDEGTSQELNLPLRPTGIIYDAVNRRPIEGTVVTLLDEQQQAIDARCLYDGQQGQRVDSAGFYALNMKPTASTVCHSGQTFQIKLTAPFGYQSDVSSLLPPQPGVLDVTQQPAEGGVHEWFFDDNQKNYLVSDTGGIPASASSDYYLRLKLSHAPIHIVNNHLALDPLGANDYMVKIKKTVNEKEAVIGDIVRYHISIENLGAIDLDGLTLIDTPPPGFRVIEDSIKLDNQPLDVVSENKQLTLGPFTLNAGETKSVQYFMRLGASLSRGVHRNSVYPEINGVKVGNESKASISVVSNQLFEQALILGKVFQDNDGDGHQDSATAESISIKGGVSERHIVANSFRYTNGNQPLAHHGDLRIGLRLGDLPGLSSQAERVNTAQTRELSFLSRSADFDQSMTIKSHGQLIRMTADGQITRKRLKTSEGSSAEHLIVTRFISPENEYYRFYIRIENHGINEVGIPGVRVASVSGNTMETDSHGRFHLAGADVSNAQRGRNLLLKVDMVTLPPGSQMTTENPRALRITQGLPVRFMFGVKLPEVLLGGNLPLITVETDHALFTPNKVNLQKKFEPQIKQLTAHINRAEGALIVLNAKGDALALNYARAVALRQHLLQSIDPQKHDHVQIQLQHQNANHKTALLRIGRTLQVEDHVFDDQKHTVKPEYQALFARISQSLQKKRFNRLIFNPTSLALSRVATPMHKAIELLAVINHQKVIKLNPDFRLLLHSDVQLTDANVSRGRGG